MDNDNIKISKVEVDILKEINKLKKSKLYDIFNRMDIFYMQFLDIVEKLYMKKTKQNVRKELTFHYIFQITLLYDELLKNVYSNNRISIEILSRTLVESLIKFIFIQKIEENICEIFKDYEDVLMKKISLKCFNKKHNENIKYVSENFGLNICLKKTNYNTKKQGLQGIIDYIINTDKNYNILLKNYKRYCSNIHANIISIQLNANNYRMGRKEDYGFMINTILIMNYSIYTIVWELYYGHFKKCIDFQKFKEFDNIYHNLGKEIEKIVC